jgi:hypothetical protein
MLRLRQSKRTLLVTLAASAMVAAAASSAYAGTAAPALSGPAGPRNRRATAPAHRADRDARSAAAGRILAAGKVQGFQQGATITRPGIR